MTDKTANKPFLPLGKYDWPKLPTEDRLRLALTRLKSEIFRADDPQEPAVANDRLEGISIERLDRLAGPPACGQLLEEMNLTLKSWVDTAETSTRTQLLVMPPCDNDVVANWANSQGLTCLKAPTRDVLIAETGTGMPDLEGDGILVIPNLEHWFLRHRNGLRSIRLLLAAVSATDRRCLIGCNSWAWTYLSSVVDAGLQLSGGITFQAFDKNRLHDWFSDLAKNPESGVASFRISSSGKDVFSTDDSGDIQSDFFQNLAAHSLGIPWVAWSLWRRSLRETRETEVEQEDVNDRPVNTDDETIWIAALEEFALPADHRQHALLVLQSLLIHGPLCVEHLRLTVPFVGQKNLIETLVRTGFLKLENGCLSCLAAAYPAIRRELSNAGYSMDRL